jgi:hypothetical protein
MTSISNKKASISWSQIENNHDKIGYGFIDAWIFVIILKRMKCCSFSLWVCSFVINQVVIVYHECSQMFRDSWPTQFYVLEIHPYLIVPHWLLTVNMPPNAHRLMSYTKTWPQLLTEWSSDNSECLNLKLSTNNHKHCAVFSLALLIPAHLIKNILPDICDKHECKFFSLKEQNRVPSFSWV